MTDRWYCPECPTSCSRKTDLVRHSKLHIGLRPFVCSECGKKFAQRGGLKTHMNTHTGDKPFKCDTCRRSFGDPSSRTRHQLESHSPAKYHCPENRCKTSIKRRSVFKAHLRKHGAKYTGVDIEAFFDKSGQSGQPSTRASKCKTAAINPADIDLTIPGLTTYDRSYTSGKDMVPYSNEYFNHISDGPLYTFDSPSSIYSSASPSLSPSSAPFDLPDQHAVHYIDIVAANASHESGMSGACPMLSPTTFMHLGLDVPLF